MAKPPWLKFARDIGVVLLIIFILFLLSKSVKAENPWRYTATWPNGNTVTITKEPCTINSVWFKGWRRAYYIWDGKPVEACWAAKGERIFTVDEEGDVGEIHAAQFRPLQKS